MILLRLPLIVLLTSILTLASAQKYSDNDSTFVSYQEQNKITSDTTNLESLVDNNPIEDVTITIIERYKKHQSDKTILYSVLVIICIVLSRNTMYRLYIDFFSFFKFLRFKQSFDIIPTFPMLSTMSFKFLLLYFAIAFALIFTVNVATATPETLSKLPFFNTYDTLSLQLALFLTLIMFLKIPLLWSIGKIFKMNNSNVHYFTYFRLSINILLFLFLLSFIDSLLFSGFFFKDYQTVIAIATYLILLRFVIVYTQLNTMNSFRKVQLFSYLCGTELIPLIIILKLMS